MTDLNMWFETTSDSGNFTCRVRDITALKLDRAGGKIIIWLSTVPKEFELLYKKEDLDETYNKLKRACLDYVR